MPFFLSFNMEDEITIIKSKLFQQKRNYMVLLSVLLGRKWIKQLATTQLHKVQPIGKTVNIFNILQLYIHERFCIAISKTAANFT